MQFTQAELYGGISVLFVGLSFFTDMLYLSIVFVDINGHRMHLLVGIIQVAGHAGVHADCNRCTLLNQKDYSCY